VHHYSPEGSLLEDVQGEDMIEIKNKLRQLDCFTFSDHAMWVGMELAKAEYKLRGRQNE